MKVELQVAVLKDLEQIKEIYDFYILNSTASFYTEPVSVDELKSFIRIGDPKYKCFMILCDGKTCGFCYFSQFNKRQAYDRTAEVSLYLEKEYTGRGIGMEVLKMMERVAMDQGICILIGYISAENHQSISLFNKAGYQECAHYRQVGTKFNRLLDVFAYEKIMC